MLRFSVVDHFKAQLVVTVANEGMKSQGEGKPEAREHLLAIPLPVTLLRRSYSFHTTVAYFHALISLVSFVLVLPLKKPG